MTSKQEPLKARIQAYPCATWGEALCVVAAPDKEQAAKFTVEAAHEAGYEDVSTDDVTVFDPIPSMDAWAEQTNGWDIGKCWSPSAAIGAVLDWEAKTAISRPVPHPDGLREALEFEAKDECWKHCPKLIQSGIVVHTRRCERLKAALSFKAKP